MNIPVNQLISVIYLLYEYVVVFTPSPSRLLICPQQHFILQVDDYGTEPMLFIHDFDSQTKTLFQTQNEWIEDRKWPCV